MLLFFTFFFSFTHLANAKTTFNFKVLTLNTWLLTVADLVKIGKTSLTPIQIASDIEYRLFIMADEIAKTDADIVALQEVWDDNLRSQLIRSMHAKGYHQLAFKEEIDKTMLTESRGFFSKHFPLSSILLSSRRGKVGNGLLLFSKQDFIISPTVNQLSFTNYTRPDEFGVIKGAIHVEIFIPDYGTIDFFVSHLGAVSPVMDKKTKRFLGYNSEHTSIRLQQALELKHFVETHSKNPVQIIAVDLNTHPFQYDTKTGNFSKAEHSKEYSVFSKEFTDSFNKTHPTLDLNTVSTFDTKSNPYAGDGVFKKLPPELIDYIFINKNQDDIKPVSSEIVFTKPIEQIFHHKGDIINVVAPTFPAYAQTLRYPQDIKPSKHLSDHYGVLTVFEINNR